LTLPSQLFAGANLEKSRFNPIKNDSGEKPEGGLWTSTFDERVGSGWVNWCRQNNFYRRRAVKRSTHWIATPRPCLVYVVRDVADLNSLFDRFPLMKQHHKILRRKVVPVPMLMGIDFEAMSKKYDAMHLTAEGQFKTKFSKPHSLYAWDCESTIWFRWMFASVRPRIIS
jgi:hypothetical protein